MKNKSKVTVITPTYDRPKVLERAINSVISQSFKDWEMIIVSDGCKRGHFLAQSYANKDPRIVPCLIPRRYGDIGSTPRNVGTILAHADLIAHLDDDNEYLPNHLESLYKLINESDADFVYSSTMLRNSSHPNIDLGIRQNPTPPRYGYIDTSELLHKKELIEKFGWWQNTHYTDVYPWGKPTGVYGTEWELINRWLQGGAKWAHSKEVTLIYYYRR